MKTILSPFMLLEAGFPRTQGKAFLLQRPDVSTELLTKLRALNGSLKKKDQGIGSESQNHKVILVGRDL